MAYENDGRQGEPVAKIKGWVQKDKSGKKWTKLSLTEIDGTRRTFGLWKNDFKGDDEMKPDYVAKELPQKDNSESAPVQKPQQRPAPAAKSAPPQQRPVGKTIVKPAGTPAQATSSNDDDVPF